MTTVSSELLPFTEQDTTSKPAVDLQNVVSRFPFQWTTPAINGELLIDEDGDLLVQRNGINTNLAILIEHSKATTMDKVGQQVWRGALLLADWVLHHAEMLKDCTLLEIGSGTGLTAVAAAAVSREVISTDVNIGSVMALISANMKRNASLIKSKVQVLELDFFAEKWSDELMDALTRTTVIIAADVIYDDTLTEAFVETIKKLLSQPPAKTIYMALEKRYVFTMADFDSVAPCFEHFLRCIAKPEFPYKLESISCDFPQYFTYEKTKELAMWKIVSNL